MIVCDLESRDFPLTEKTWYRVKRCLKDGREKIDIRVWYKFENNPMEIPTRTGIMFDVKSQAAEIFSFVNSLLMK